MQKPALSRLSLPAGAFVFLEGDKDSHFYIIEAGEVEIFTQSAGALKHLTLAHLKAGDSFGEFALLDHAPRSASARAVSNVDLVKIPTESFEQMLSEIPEWAACMLRNFATRLTHMTERLKDVPQFVSQTKAAK